MGAVAQKDKMVAYFGEFYELWLQLWKMLWLLCLSPLPRYYRDTCPHYRGTTVILVPTTAVLP